MAKSASASFVWRVALALVMASGRWLERLPAPQLGSFTSNESTETAFHGSSRDRNWPVGVGWLQILGSLNCRCCSPSEAKVFSLGQYPMASYAFLVDALHRCRQYCTLDGTSSVVGCCLSLGKGSLSKHFAPLLLGDRLGPVASIGEARCYARELFIWEQRRLRIWEQRRLRRDASERRCYSRLPKACVPRCDRAGSYSLSCGTCGGQLIL